MTTSNQLATEPTSEASDKAELGNVPRASLFILVLRSVLAEACDLLRCVSLSFILFVVSLLLLGRVSDHEWWTFAADVATAPNLAVNALSKWALTAFVVYTGFRFVTSRPSAASEGR